MKACTCIIIVLLLISTSAIASTTIAASVPSVGVKEGDWIEYNITISGTGQPPPTHDVRWMQLYVLQVEGTAFSVNVTARYANGSVGSAVWKFNFAEGNVGGWIIIPADLGVGSSFYDSSIHNHKPVNVTIQSQEQKTVLGAARIVTCGNDSFRHKQWDQATGVFVASSETYRNVTNKDGWYIDNLTVTIEATATNLWSSTVAASNQSMFYPLVGAIVTAAALLTLLITAARRKHVTLTVKQKQLIEVLLVLGLVFAVGLIASTPINESQVPLSFRDLNMIMQTLWMGLLLLGMWFRSKGNYFLHGVLTILVVSITIMGFLGVLAMSPMSDSSSMNEYFDSPLDLAVFLGHAVFSFPALAFGVWLIMLWRPNSATFPAKSRRIAWLTTVFWVLSYIVGVIDYVMLRNDFF